MTTVTAKVIADSISEFGKRIITFQLRYPRIVHAQLMTHRMFSRNASSSRAVPSERLIQEVLDDPYVPRMEHEQKGMQTAGPLGVADEVLAYSAWFTARDAAVTQARKLIGLGVHHDSVNRLLEPFGHIHVIVTATEYGNFYNLRQDSHAHYLMRMLSTEMLIAANNSKPKHVAVGEWHLPYVTETEWTALTTAECKAVSVARCARISYAMHDGSAPVVGDDLVLHEKLKTNLHMSAFEHQATPIYADAVSANFIGWRQYRREIPNENRPKFDGLK